MVTTAGTLTLALQHHQAGELPQAEELYHLILDVEPRNVEALNALGLLAHQLGWSDRAVHYLGEALGVDPLHVGARNNLGEVFRQQGRLTEALACFEEVLRLQPNSPQALNNRALVQLAQGKLVEAIASLQDALSVQPNHASAHNNLGTIHSEQGRLAEAVASFQQALACRPNYPEACNNLGSAFHRQGRLAEAVASFQQALRFRPNYAEPYVNLGNLFCAHGQLEEAVASYREALRLGPNQAEAHRGLGIALQRQGRPAEAQASVQHSLRLKPHDALALHTLGLIFQDQGRFEEALASYEQALRLDPNSAETLCNLANSLQEQGKLDEALSRVQQALRLRPDNANAYNNLGNIQRAQGKLDEARASFTQAVRLAPGFAAAYNNLGLILTDEGKLEEALARFAEAVRLEPNFADGYNNLGRALADLNRPDEAQANYQQALRLVPQHAEAHGNLGLFLAAQGKLEEAEAHVCESLRLRPNPTLRVAHAILLPIIYQSAEEVLAWRHRITDQVRRLHEDSFTLDLTTQAAPTPFFLAYQGLDDRDLLRELTRLYVPPPDHARLERPVRNGGKIRAGFISHYFRKHTVAKLMRGLIAQLSRDAFAVTVLSVGSYHDDYARFFQQQADVFLEVPANLPAARRLIAEQALDVLIYTDIGMDPTTYSLAFSRLAPVQCAAWGHGVTSGIPTLDYFLSGALLETEEGDQHYTERLVRLPNLGVYYYRPVLPALLKGRGHFGLPEDAHLYACLQTLFKFHPDFDALLGGIMRRDAHGVVVLIQGKYPHWTELLQQRFAATLPDVLDRIHFLPPQANEDFLNLMALADVLLDPLYNVGGNSSFEGFALAKPIVTLPTRHLGGRLTWALYAQMGVWDCVANSKAEYVDKAVRLGTDTAYREAVQARIRAASDVLYENPAGVRGLERFLQKAVAAV